MKTLLVVGALAATVAAQVGPFGVPFDKKGKTELKGKTFKAPAASQIIADSQDVLFESCIIQPEVGLGILRVAGKVRFRGCLLIFIPGLAHQGFQAEGNGSIVFEDCIFAGIVQVVCTKDYAKGGASRGTVLFERCRFQTADHRLKGVDDSCEIKLSGAGITFKSCDFNGVSSVEAIGTAGPTILPGDKKKGADEVIIDAKNCWWNNADEAGVRAKIKDRTTGLTTFMGEPVNARIAFLPLAKAPFTTKLKAPEEKTSGPTEKK